MEVIYYGGCCKKEGEKEKDDTFVEDQEAT
jgi:hypothetical protein